jgi:hypothetical protein
VGLFEPLIKYSFLLKAKSARHRKYYSFKIAVDRVTSLQNEIDGDDIKYFQIPPME